MGISDKGLTNSLTIWTKISNNKQKAITTVTYIINQDFSKFLNEFKNSQS